MSISETVFSIIDIMTFTLSKLKLLKRHTHFMKILDNQHKKTEKYVYIQQLLKYIYI